MRWSSGCVAALVLSQAAPLHAASGGTGEGLGQASTVMAAGSASAQPDESNGSQPADVPATAASESESGDTSALFLTGLYLTVFGGATMIGGLLYTTAGPGEYCPNCAAEQFTALGYVAILGGFAAATTGAVLVVLGARQDAPDEAASESTSAALAIGPSGASLRLSF